MGKSSLISVAHNMPVWFFKDHLEMYLETFVFLFSGGKGVEKNFAEKLIDGSFGNNFSGEEMYMFCEDRYMFVFFILWVLDNCF